MAQLDYNIPSQALSQFKGPSPLEQLAQAAPIADIFQKQKQQEQMADIFSRNIQVNPTTGQREVNKQGALAELYGQQPTAALQFESGFLPMEQEKSKLAMLAYKQGLVNQFSQLKPQLDKIMTPPQGGWNPLTGEKGLAYSKVLSAIPPELYDVDEAKTYMSNISKENQQQVFNPYAISSQNRQQTIQTENQLRDEYNTQMAPARTVATAGQDIFSALNTNDPLSVRTAVTKFSKVIDPTTGVLGGEANAAEKKAMGDLMNRFQGAFETMVTGKMTPKTIQSFKNATHDILQTQKKIAQRIQNRVGNQVSSYQKRFPELGLDKTGVLGSKEDVDSELKAFDLFKSKPTGPSVGAIINGFKFKGGDPNDKNSWAKVK